MDFAAAVYLFEYIHIPQYFFTGEGGGEAEFWTTKNAAEHIME